MYICLTGFECGEGYSGFVVVICFVSATFYIVRSSSNFSSAELQQNGVQIMVTGEFTCGHNLCETSVPLTTKCLLCFKFGHFVWLC